MTTDVHTKIMLENWGFLAEVGDWETLEKAVNLYLEQNRPLIYPKGTSDSLPTCADSLLPKEKYVRSLLIMPNLERNGTLRGSRNNR